LIQYKLYNFRDRKQIDNNSDGSLPWDLEDTELREDMYVLLSFEIIFLIKINLHILFNRQQFDESSQIIPTITSPTTLSLNTSEDIDEIFKVTSSLFQDKNLVKKGFYNGLPVIKYEILKFKND
jgi:hypothetical protein